MSWLARSLANSLKLDDDHYSENDVASHTSYDSTTTIYRNEEGTREMEKEIDSNKKQQHHELEEEEEAHGRGVKEDLTELKQTLTRQLWGVASFLAPPPDNLDQSPVASDRSASPRDEREPSDSRIKHDFSEIGGRFKEISKMASNYFPFGSEANERENLEKQGQEELETEVDGRNVVDDDDDLGEGGGIGITDESLAFARNIAMHPETWLDFPLDEEDDLDDFDMSDAQRAHASAIERFAPRLAALRIELCPCHMTESYFWKVYFVLLHSRLNKHDAEFLSTPQVMEARAMWMQELHKQIKPEFDWFGTSIVKDSDNFLNEDSRYARSFDFEPTTSTATDHETENYPVATAEMHFIDKGVIVEKSVIKTEDKDKLAGSSSKMLAPNYEEDEDDWPDEEDSDLGGYKTIIPVGNEEDISFSDLEDDACSTIPIKPKRISEGTETST